MTSISNTLPVHSRGAVTIIVRFVLRTRSITNLDTKHDKQINTKNNLTVYRIFPNIMLGYKYAAIVRLLL